MFGIIGSEWPWWLPIAAVAAMTLLALLAALARPPGPGRSAWFVGLLICGIAAVAATAVQQAAMRDLLRRETARLEDLGSRLDELGALLPQGPGKSTADTFDSVSAAIRTLNARIEELQEQIRTMQENYRARTIDPETAARLAAYIRQSGPHRAVVSTVPGDVEAFAYANQIANILREAGWEAMGPEMTTIFGTPTTAAITLYARSPGTAPDSVRSLIDAFTRFNIPYRSGIAPNDSIPDAATVELFVSRKA